MARDIVNVNMIEHLTITIFKRTKTIGFSAFFLTLLYFKSPFSHNSQIHVAIPRTGATGLSSVLTCGKLVENPYLPVENLWIPWGKVRQKIRINFFEKR